MDQSRTWLQKLVRVVLVLFVLATLAVALFFFIALQVIQVNTGASTAEIINRELTPDYKAVSASNRGSAGFMQVGQRFLQDLYERDSIYPVEKTAFDLAWSQQVNPNPKRFPWDMGIEYFSINAGHSYILRTRLEKDYTGLLEEERDKDGNQGGVDCSDIEGYLCFGPL